jgi:hypothetical protein
MSFFPDSLLVLQLFAGVFTRPTFSHMRTLVYGILLASNRRTVTTALRACIASPKSNQGLCAIGSRLERLMDFQRKLARAMVPGSLQLAIAQASRF